MKHIEIGVITKAQGLKGEVRIKLHSNNFELLNSVHYLFINGEKFDIINKNNRNTFAVIKINGIDHINQTEKLINKKAYIYEQDITLNEDEYFVSELVNYKVMFEYGEPLGILVNISNYGAGDIYTVKLQNDKEILFANVREVILNIDSENKTITLNKEIFNEVCV